MNIMWRRNSPTPRNCTLRDGAATYPRPTHKARSRASRTCSLNSGVALMFRASQAVSAAIRSVIATATANALTCETTAKPDGRWVTTQLRLPVSSVARWSMPNGGRTIPSTSSHPAAVRILKDAALQPAATSAWVPCSFRLVCFMPGCIVRPTAACFSRSFPKCPARSRAIKLSHTAYASATDVPAPLTGACHSWKGLNWIHLYKCQFLLVRQAVLLMANATATHRLVRDVPAGLAGSGERQLRFDVVGDDGVDDLAVDPAVGREVDAHPIGRRRGNCHGLFDTDADEPGMVIEAALLATERSRSGSWTSASCRPWRKLSASKPGRPASTTTSN